jgi:very-short-patch-repair endonuclease
LELDISYKRRNKPENQRRESEEDNILIESGYQILRINELEWENDPTGTLKKCLDFIIS